MSIQSVEQAWQLLGEIDASGQLSVRELSERTQLPKSTVSRLLKTLVGVGAVQRTGHGEYSRVAQDSSTELAGEVDDYLAHELSSELSMIVRLAQNLDSETGKSIRAHARRAERALRVSRLAASFGGVQPQTLQRRRMRGDQLGRICKDLIEDLAFLDRYDDDLTVRYREEKPLERLFLGHSGSLSSTIYNVLDNPLRYASAGSLVLVSLQLDDNQLVLAVQNEGARISEQELDRVRDSGYRGAEAGSLSPRGLGLGLWLSDRVMEAHGGDLKILTDESVTTVELRFPLVDEQ